MHFQGNAIGLGISKTVFRHTSVHCTVCFAHILDSELPSLVKKIHSRTVPSVHRISISSP